MNKYKFAIFDLDGTIIDAITMYTKVFSEILNIKYGINIWDSKSYYLDSIGNPIEVQFGYMLKKNNRSVEVVPQLVNEFFETVNKVNFNLFEGAEEIIVKFYKEGLKLFITTGSQTIDTQQRLRKMELLKYFSFVLGSELISKGPQHIEKFSQVTNTSIEDFSRKSFYCGDGSSDMEIAKHFGIYAVGIAQTLSKEKLFKAGADVVVDQIRDVVKLEILK